MRTNIRPFAPREVSTADPLADTDAMALDTLRALDAQLAAMPPPRYRAIQRSEPVYAIRSCTGPCDHGDKRCPSPDACQLAEDDFGVIRGLLVALILTASIAAAVTLAGFFLPAMDAQPDKPAPASATVPAKGLT